MTAFQKTPSLDKQSNMVIYVKRLDPAAMKWVGTLAPAFLCFLKSILI